MKKKEGKEERERHAAHEVANYRKGDDERKATKAWMDGMQRSHGREKCVDRRREKRRQERRKRSTMTGPRT